MYVSLSFIILEILLGLVFLVVLYFMLRELLKKMLRKELETIREPLNTLADYLVGKAQMEAAAEQMAAGDEVEGDLHTPAEGPNEAQTKTAVKNNPGQKKVAVEPSPEKLPLEPVDVADEFNALKNANRINAYNLRVQKIWELYKSKKINIKQYNEELVRLKKEFSIGMETDADADEKAATDADDATEKMAPVKKLELQQDHTPTKSGNQDGQSEPDSDTDKTSGKESATSSQQKVARKPDNTRTEG